MSTEKYSCIVDSSSFSFSLFLEHESFFESFCSNRSV